MRTSKPGLLPCQCASAPGALMGKGRRPVAVHVQVTIARYGNQSSLILTWVSLVSSTHKMSFFKYRHHREFTITALLIGDLIVYK